MGFLEWMGFKDPRDIDKIIKTAHLGKAEDYASSNHMTLQQYKLESGNEIIVAWLEAGRVKVGDSVTLKDNDDPEKLWEVVEAYSKVDSTDLKDGHDSGKVFGSIQGRG